MRQYEPGERIGGEYTVLKVFGGVGLTGMGVVYLVEHRELQKPIVLKTFQSLLSLEAQERFLAEARAWVGVGNHPNIVQALWVREMAGQVFVAAEFVEPDDMGRNRLLDYLRGGPIHLGMILQWAIHFCSGMLHAQSRGVVAHRDIKPDNLMIDPSGILKVTDFGLAKSVEGGSHTSRPAGHPVGSRVGDANTRTVTGVAMGTYAYSAPEQSADASSVDHRADIYSFGIVLYQMATGGGYPYAIRDDIDRALAIPLAHAEQAPMDIESPLMPIISRCLAKRREDRYDTYDDFVRDLKGLAGELGFTIEDVPHVIQEDEDLYAKAESYCALGDSERALWCISEYVAKYPERSCGWTSKGRIHSNRNEYAESIAATKRSLEISPYNSHAWNNIGLQFINTRAPFWDVRAAFGNALRYDPLNTGAMMNFAGQFILAKRCEEAASLVIRALGIAPDKPLVLYRSWELLHVAIEAEQQAVIQKLLPALRSAQPVDQFGWYSVGLIALDCLDVAGAVACFESVCELGPAIDPRVRAIAQSLLAEYLDYCNRQFERRDETLQIVTIKAHVLNFAGEYESAVGLLHSVLEDLPQNIGLWLTLAHVHESARENDLAVRALVQAERLLASGIGEGQAQQITGIENWLTRLMSQG